MRTSEGVSCGVIGEVFKGPVVQVGGGVHPDSMQREYSAVITV